MITPGSQRVTVTTARADNQFFLKANNYKEQCDGSGKSVEYRTVSPLPKGA